MASVRKLLVRASRASVRRRVAVWWTVVVVAALTVPIVVGVAPAGAAPRPATFAAKTDFASGAFPVSVAVGDFNGDAKADLAVANFNSDSVSVLLGSGTGSFGAKTDFATGTGPLFGGGGGCQR